MGKFKLFISHSSRTEESKQMLSMVREAFDNEDHIEVLVDKEIQPSTEWFPEINEWMMECHAAIILMSEEALEGSSWIKPEEHLADGAEWVKSEAAVLCARKRADKDFILITIPINSVTPKKISEQSFFKTIRLDDFNFVENCKDDEERIERTKNLLNKYKKINTPFDDVVNQISDILDEINLKPLQRAWEKLSHDNYTKWNCNDSTCYAENLARELIRRPSSAISDLKELLQPLAHIVDWVTANKLLEIIKTLWVNSEAAAFLDLSKDSQDFIAINCTQIEKFTGKSYARRAWPFPKPMKFIPVGDKRIFSDIEEIIISHLAGSALDESRKIKMAQRYSDPALLVFPFPESTSNVDEPLLEEISNKYPNITILVATGDTVPDHKDYLSPIEPLLKQNQEETQCCFYEDTYDYIIGTIKNP